MKIGIIRDTFFTNEPRGYNIAKVLEKQGHSIEVLCYGDENKIEKLSDNITLNRFKTHSFIRKKLFALVETFPIYKYLWFFKIKKFIKENNIEILHIHDLYMSGAAILANKFFNIPMVLVMHENYVKSIKSYGWANGKISKYIVRPHIWEKKEAKYLKHYNKYLVPSEIIKDDIVNKYEFVNTQDVYIQLNCPDLKQYDLEKKYPKNDKFNLVYFGVIGYRRGLHTAIEAIKQLKKQIPNIHLTYIGPIDNDSKSMLESLSNDLEVKNYVTHVKWIEIEQFGEYMSNADICISPLVKNPHNDTALANKLFQYMLYKKPLLVSNTTLQVDLVNKIQCGEIHKSEDVQDFADKVIYMHSNWDLMKSKAEKGYKAVIEKYNVKKQSEELTKFYDKFVEEIKANN